MSRYKRVLLAELVVDDSYQRDLNDAHVQRIVGEFNPALLGTLEVSRRNGQAAVIDGQHRLAALLLLNAKDAPCIVHEGLSPEEEADLFVQHQDRRRRLRPIDRFKARLRSGEDRAHAIVGVAKDHGYSVIDGGHEHEIGAVTALDRVYALGGVPLLNATFDLLTTWKGEPRSTDGALIEGLAIAYQRFHEDKRWAGISPALEGITATSLLRKAIAALEMGGGSSSRPQAVAKEIGRLVGIRGPYKKPKKP